jgi:hypothetical protein
VKGDIFLSKRESVGHGKAIDSLVIKSHAEALIGEMLTHFEANLKRSAQHFRFTLFVASAIGFAFVLIEIPAS